MDERGDRNTTVERTSERDLVASRTFDAPARVVFEAWTRPHLFMQWWAPKSTNMTLLSCEMDVRVGGGYRVEFGHPAAEQPATFFGRYIEVVSHASLAWTNEESDDGAVTTVTFEEKGGRTLLVLHERYPTKEALDGALEGMLPEQFQQLEELLAAIAVTGHD